MSKELLVSGVQLMSSAEQIMKFFATSQDS